MARIYGRIPFLGFVCLVLTGASVAYAQIAALANPPVTRAADVKSSRSFVYHGKLVRPDGSAPTGSLSVTLKILSPDPKLCVLWSETQTVEVKDGGFSVELGHGVHRLPGASGGAAADFKQAFINNPSLTISSASCASGNSYTPSVSDDRLLSATFNDAGAVIEIAGLPVKSVPFALQAEEIGGYGLANLVKISGAGNNATLAPAELDELKLLADTTLPLDLKNRRAKNAADPVDPQDLVTKAYYQANLPTGTGLGTVTNLSVGGAPLSVTNPTTTPQISIAAANTTTSGYLTAADWNTFNAKQPAGSYLTTVTAANVTGALGFTPVNQTLTQNQVYIGNASNVATGGYLGLSHLRNPSGLQQFPSACGAHQTMTWSAITDVLSCTSINNLDADKITAGTMAAARLGSGTADATKYLRGDGTWQTLPSGADNLGNHSATQNLNLATYQLVGNGGSSGLAINSAGRVGIGTSSPTAVLDVTGAIGGEPYPFNATLTDTTAYAQNVGGGLGFRANTNTGSTLSIAGIQGAKENATVGDYSGALRFFTRENGSPMSEKVRVDSLGNVGIGTASPLARTHVRGTGAGVSVNALMLQNDRSQANSEVSLQFAPSTLPDTRYSAISAVNDGSNNIDLKFTTGAGASITEKMRITATGAVGIGTVSPSAHLHIYNPSDSSAHLKLEGNRALASGGYASVISFGAPASPAATDQKNFMLANVNGASAGENYMSLTARSDDFSTAQNLLVVQHSGNVGIGVSAPAERLQVNGKVRGTELCIGTDCRSSWPASGGGGAVQSVSVGGLPLSVVNSSTTPTVSITQANTTTAGYLSAADWNTFNGKLSSITSGNVTTALGFTPLSQTLGANQVFVGNGSNVATASFFGIEQMRNASGVAQFPGACSASQTLTWSAITDVLSCTNINNLNADKITAGTIATARLGSGTANATTYLRGDGTWATIAGGGSSSTVLTEQASAPTGLGANEGAIYYQANSSPALTSDGQTVLLLNNNGANGSTTFTDASSNAYAVTTSGTVVHSTTQAISGSSSYYFNGASYLQVADNTNWDIDTNFTMEAWVWLDDIAASRSFFGRYGDGSNFFDVGHSSSYQLYFTFYGGSNNGGNHTMSSGYTITTQQWHHIAFVRSGTSAVLYVDGVARISSTWSGTFNITAPIRIGWSPYITSNSTAGYMKGYMDEIRITKGLARYTGAFAPPGMDAGLWFKDKNGATSRVGAAASGGASSDNLGNHTATTNVRLGTNWLSGDGDNEGLQVDGSGNVGIGTATPASKLEVAGVIHSTTGGIKFPDGTTQSTANTSSIITNRLGTKCAKLALDDYGAPDRLPISCSLGQRVERVGVSLRVVGGTYLTSCLSYLNTYPETAGYDGGYWIDPDGAGAGAAFETYCDMTTSGGGWTLVAQGSAVNASAVGTPRTVNTAAASAWKLSDANINLIKSGSTYQMYFDSSVAGETTYARVYRHSAAWTSTGTMDTAEVWNGSAFVTTGNTGLTASFYGPQHSAGSNMYCVLKATFGSPFVGASNFHWNYSSNQYFRCGTTTVGAQGTTGTYIR